MRHLPPVSWDSFAAVTRRVAGPFSLENDQYVSTT